MIWEPIVLWVTICTLAVGAKAIFEWLDNLLWWDHVVTCGKLYQEKIVCSNCASRMLREHKRW